MTLVLTHNWHHPSPALSTATALTEVAREDDSPLQEIQEALGEGHVPKQAGLFPAIGMVALGQPGSITKDRTAAAELVLPSERISYDNICKM